MSDSFSYNIPDVLDPHGLTKPMKTLPTDEALPNITVPSESTAEPKDTETSSEIQKGLDRAKEMAAKPSDTTPQPKPPSPSTQQQSGAQQQSSSKAKQPEQEDRAGQEAYSDMVSRFEGGSADAKNPNSTAAGWHQFEEGTWLDTIKKFRPDLVEGKTPEQILALRGNKEISTEMAIDYAKENIPVLREAGFEPTKGNLLLAHFLGPRGAVNFLSAPGSDQASMHMSPEAVSANPWVKGLTIDQMKKTMEIKANGGRVTSTGEGTDNPATRGRVVSTDPELRMLMKRMLELHPAAPGLSWNNGHAGIQKDENPWTKTFVEFAQYASAILAASAVAGSKRGKIASIGAMGAMANAINGVTEGNQAKYKNNVAKFEAETKRMAEQNAWEAEQYKRVFEENKENQAALLGALRAKALELQDEKLAASIAHGDATLAEMIMLHREQMQRHADDVARAGETVFHNPKSAEFFTWFNEQKEKLGRPPNSEEIQQHNLEEMQKEKAATRNAAKMDPRSEFFSTWHDDFMQKNGREPTSEEWGDQEKKWKEASATAKSLSPQQEEQQRQITFAQNGVRTLQSGKPFKLPDGDTITPDEWQKYAGLTDGSPLSERQKNVLAPLWKLANKRLEDSSGTPITETTPSTANGGSGDNWQPPPGAVAATPEQRSKFTDGQIVTKNKNDPTQYVFDAQHGYFVPAPTAADAPPYLAAP